MNGNKVRIIETFQSTQYKFLFYSRHEDLKLVSSFLMRDTQSCLIPRLISFLDSRFRRNDSANKPLGSSGRRAGDFQTATRPITSLTRVPANWVSRFRFRGTVKASTSDLSRGVWSGLVPARDSHRKTVRPDRSLCFRVSRSPVPRDRVHAPRKLSSARGFAR